jgi:DNA-binding NarL/FixJ family response regulator
LVEWYQQGKTITYIAGQLGISESCVRYRLKAAGILVNRKPLKVTDAEKRKFCKLYKNGKSVKEIAKICKRNPSTIRKYLRESKKDAL